MSDWADQGLPNPEKTGYGYSISAGLLQAPVATAQPQQRRVQTADRKEFTLVFRFTLAELKIAATYLAATGWFTIDLLSGQNPAVFTEHSVRVISKIKKKFLGPDFAEMSFTVENDIYWIPPTPPSCTGNCLNLGSQPGTNVLNLGTI